MQRPQTNARQHPVVPPAELGKHRPSVGFITRFAEHEPIEIRHRIGRDNHGARIERRGIPVSENLLPNCRRLSKCQFRHQPRRPRFAADATLHVLIRRNYRELISSLLQQLTPPRRTAGQYQRRERRAIGWGRRIHA